jgi:serine phosphatase RsbU (regulator of sigma subunit)
MSTASQQISLQCLAGPQPVDVELNPEKPVTVGRRLDNSVVLDHPTISRTHAEFRYDASGDRWQILDRHSRLGTWLNGVKLESGRAVPLMPGDRISIGPWMFRVVDAFGAGGLGDRTLTIDDLAATGATISAVQPDSPSSLAQEHLQLLLNCAESIPLAGDETSLADAVLGALVSGTGFMNAAFLRPMASDGSVELIAQRSANDVEGPLSIGRSLIREASKGNTVRWTASNVPADHTSTMMRLNVTEAVCVPLQHDQTILGYLYLDNRSTASARARSLPDAGAFAVGIGRLASMALVNLTRQDVERRFAVVRGELAAAARTQQLILPKATGEIGPFTYVGECRPGRTVSGDFYDIIPLTDGRLAVTLGDVVGKGVSASVLMTTSQGFLHGALCEHGDPNRAVCDLNRFLLERSAEGRFVTLWVGVFDAEQSTLTYVDAGHGYAFLARADDTISLLTEGGGPPVGIMSNQTFVTTEMTLPTSGRLVVVSDGVIEQPAEGPENERSNDEFGRARVEEAVTAAAAQARDETQAIFAALVAHAGGPSLADDATVLVVRW